MNELVSFKANRRRKRLRVIAFKVTDEELAAIENVAGLYFDGNVSAYIRSALSACGEFRRTLDERKPTKVTDLLKIGLVALSVAFPHGPRRVYMAAAVAVVGVIHHTKAAPRRVARRLRIGTPLVPRDRISG